MSKGLWRAIIETGFIVFLFYANLLMGEFESGGAGTRGGWGAAARDVITPTNFAIALGAAFVGYGCVEFLRKRL